MKCPKCDADTKIVNSRDSGDAKNERLIPQRYRMLSCNFTYRVHKCHVCDSAFKSIELMAETVDDIISTIEDGIKHKVRQQLLEIHRDI